MESDATIPSRTVGLPLRELSIRVGKGPDAGASVVARDETVTIGSAPTNTIVLRDRTVSRFHLELRRKGDRIAVTDLGSTNGTFAGPVRVDDASVSVAPGTTIRIGNSEIELAEGPTTVVQKNEWNGLGEIKGKSEPMQRLMDSVSELAHHAVSVLLVGESGTGKELVARALHDLGPRADGPFVVVDCGAISPSLFASELFGHERGSFTGASHTHVGAIERADGGTLFLDEIGELPQEQQVALLGVLERRTLRRVGGTEEIAFDIRVVSATNRDLRSEVNSGVFRLDLYYRLAVVLVSVPSLRDRRDDIPLLIEHFMADEGARVPLETLFPRAVIEQLKSHRWPGNVRELRNVVAAAIAIGHAAIPDHDAPPPGADVIRSVLELDYKSARRIVTDSFETAYLKRLLERSNGSVRAAARLGQVDRNYLSNLLKRHRIR
jgi:DNA-binding NtrC family response regulator